MLFRNVIAFVVLLALASPVHADEYSPTATQPVADENTSEDSDEPWFTPSYPNKHYWLTTLELGITVAGGMTWYWLDRERQVADWDYPAWKDKVLFKRDIFIFDNNPFMVNYSWHTFAGSASQVLGRANGLGIYETAAMGMGASVVWEYGIEARELISLNDLLITNTTGIAAGEFFHRLGQYARHPDHTGIAWEALRWTLGVSHEVHELWDKDLQEEPTIWPRFRFSYGLSSADVSRQDGAGAAEQNETHLIHSLAFDGSLVAMEHYMEPGRRSGIFTQGNFTSFQLKLSTGDGDSTNAYADTVLVGWRTENIPEEDEDRLGYALNIGTSIGYRYQRETLGVWRDRLGGLHLPGIATEGEVFGKHWRLRWRGRAHLDLTGVNALSWQRWKDAHYDEDTKEIGKSILENTGYYYAWGASVTGLVELELPIVTLGSSVFMGNYYSIEGFDRIRNEGLPYEVHASDDFFDGEAWLRANVYHGLYAEGRIGEHRRNGQLGELFADESMRRYTLEVGGIF